MSAARGLGPSVRRSLIIGAAVALLALLAGVLLAATQDRVWTAESVVVVLPAPDLDDATSAAYYETMSRGQIVATFAEVAGNLRFEEQAEDRLGLDATERTAVSTEVSVVPDTSVILIRVSSDDAALSERVADATTAVSSEYLGGLSRPFRTETVHTAQGTAYSSGTSPVLLIAATVVVALVAGLAVQQAVYHLLVALPAPALRRRPAVAGDPDEVAPSATRWNWW